MKVVNFRVTTDDVVAFENLRPLSWTLENYKKVALAKIIIQVLSKEIIFL